MSNCRWSRFAAVAAAVVVSMLVMSCGVDPGQPGRAAPTVSAPSARQNSPSPASIPSAAPGSGASTSPAPKPWERKPPDCTKKKCIALTFDDGPLEYTPQLATILTEEKVRATFFMLGQNVEKYPQAVRDVQATGSELGNHSWNHPSLPSLSTTAMRSQLTRTNAAIKKAAGVEVTVMRPPYGANNHRVDLVARDLGLAEIYWNVDTLDWKYPSSQRLITYVLGNARRNQVVLMHDIHPTTVEAARTIIRGLKNRGYTLVTVSELYPKARPGGHYPTWQGRGLARMPEPQGRQ